MSKPLGAATARAAIEQAPTVRAPLFFGLMERMAEGQRWLVLDLGPARNETLALLGQFRCRVDIADLTHDVDLLDAELEPDALAQLIEGLLPVNRGDLADVVLCWDLLNYLPRKALHAVMTAVAARSKPGAHAHALIAYNDKTDAARPGRFYPAGAGVLANPSKAEAQRPAVRHPPADLTASAPGLSIERAVLMSNGMQEYLFRF